MKNTLLFDFDLTLADSSKGIFKCVNHALMEMGYSEKKYNDIKLTIGHSLPATFKILTGNNTKEQANDFVRLFVEKADKIMNDNTTIFKEVYSLMPVLKKNGYKTGIISTKYRYRIEGILQREQLQPFFNIIIGGEDVKSHKPDPEGMQMAINKLNVEPNQVLYIGDSLVDLQAAKAANVDFAAVLTGTVTKDEFITYNCLYILPNLNHLNKIMKIK